MGKRRIGALPKHWIFDDWEQLQYHWTMTFHDCMTSNSDSTWKAVVHRYCKCDRQTCYFAEIFDSPHCVKWSLLQFTCLQQRIHNFGDQSAEHDTKKQERTLTVNYRQVHWAIRAPRQSRWFTKLRDAFGIKLEALVKIEETAPGEN